jgi:hypothetical protein
VEDGRTKEALPVARVVDEDEMRVAPADEAVAPPDAVGHAVLPAGHEAALVFDQLEFLYASMSTCKAEKAYATACGRARRTRLLPAGDVATCPGSRYRSPSFGNDCCGGTHMRAVCPSGLGSEQEGNASVSTPVFTRLGRRETHLAAYRS